MQTFLPYADFRKSASVLDRQRLGKQRVEVLQIVKVLTGHSSGWSHHPAVLMWKGHIQALVEYGFDIIQEWTDRGYKDTCRDKICELVYDISDCWYPENYTVPSWMGDTAFHTAHRSNLLRKFPQHYRKFWPKLSDSLPYVWPVQQGVTL